MKSKKPGRPPVPIAERKTYVYPVRLNKAQHKTLVKLSKTEDTPVSVVIRNMVDEYFRRQLVTI